MNVKPCPRCGSKKITRERSPNGSTRCSVCMCSMKHAAWDEAAVAPRYDDIPSAAAGAAESVYWLVERTDGPTPQWAVFDDTHRAILTWTSDVHGATKFGTEGEAAVAFDRQMGVSWVREAVERGTILVTEHSDMSLPRVAWTPDSVFPRPCFVCRSGSIHAPTDRLQVVAECDGCKRRFELREDGEGLYIAPMATKPAPKVAREAGMTDEQYEELLGSLGVGDIRDFIEEAIGLTTHPWKGSSGMTVEIESGIYRIEYSPREHLLDGPSVHRWIGMFAQTEQLLEVVVEAIANRVNERARPLHVIVEAMCPRRGITARSAIYDEAEDWAPPGHVKAPVKVEPTLLGSATKEDA